MANDLSRSVRLQFGPYRILEKIGAGGMAKVYKASHQETGAIVALKIADELSALDSTLCKRFQREFDIAKNLDHPNLIRALACGEEDDALYQALEYVPGQNLEQRIRDKGALPLTEAIAIFQQVGDALRTLHAGGLLHRDIKPSNVMLTEQGTAKLGDFGLLKNLKSQSSLLTQSRQSLGTIGYSAPEQFEDAKHTDARCDIYSLAATFYAAVTGQPPFGSGGQLKILRRKFLGQFVPLREMAQGISADLDKFINRALNVDPKNRPADCAEFLDCLDRQRRDRSAGKVERQPEKRDNASKESNRRKANRAPVQLAAQCEPMFIASRRSWPASISNLSTSGVCLHLDVQVPVDTILQVSLYVTEMESAASRLVRVRWIHSTKDKFKLGCAFVEPLTPVEFDVLHDAGSPKTAVVSAG